MVNFLIWIFYLLKKLIILNSSIFGNQINSNLYLEEVKYFFKLPKINSNLIFNLLKNIIYLKYGIDKMDLLQSLDMVKLNQDLFKKSMIKEQILSFVNSGFKIIPNAFSGFEFNNLLQLDLTKNKIKSLKKSFLNGLTNVREINLDYCSICEIEFDAFEDSINLKRLNLSWNNFENNLNKNQLNCLKNLEILQLSQCQIDHIKSHLFHELTYLKELDLSFNKIEKIDFLIGLKNLEKLNLNNCFIKQIDTNSFNEMFSLKELYLRENLIEILNPIKGLENLLIFDLFQCKLKAIEPDCFKNMNNLKELDLSFNQIKIVKQELFNRLTHLEILNLENCDIKIIENKSFANLKNLTNLNLSWNLIEKINKETLYGLYKLEVLNLQNCLINFIETNSFINCNQLLELNLSNNIKIVRKNTFEGLNKLKLKIIYSKRCCLENISHLQEFYLEENF